MKRIILKPLDVYLFKNWDLEINRRFIYYLLTESEVITGKHQTEALLDLMYWPSDSEVNTYFNTYFPVMTERARLTSCLLHGLFIMDLSLRSRKLTAGQRKNKPPQWVDTWARDTVRWHWSADTLFDSCQMTMTWVSTSLRMRRHTSGTFLVAGAKIHFYSWLQRVKLKENSRKSTTSTYFLR